MMTRPSSGQINIAARTKKLDVDNRISLRIYYRIADNVLKQADIFRAEGDVVDLYVMLLRFSSLVSETIPCHRDYRASLQSNKNLDERAPSTLHYNHQKSERDALKMLRNCLVEAIKVIIAVPLRIAAPVRNWVSSSTTPQFLLVKPIDEHPICHLVSYPSNVDLTPVLIPRRKPLQSEIIRQPSSTRFFLWEIPCNLKKDFSICDGYFHEVSQVQYHNKILKPVVFLRSLNMDNLLTCRQIWFVRQKLGKVTVPMWVNEGRHMDVYRRHANGWSISS
ncbi:hypothetical protein HAX54_006160 [Datura stramonium]|uniref:USP8 dimerisation domain-containing protein n=1 Tax=Datura stramonium TaxID=4076 RepID=A0ABS8WTU3_DATST|nr:hypothetical protein [Datura stramonium]